MVSRHHEPDGPIFHEAADAFSRMIRRRHYHQHQDDPEATATFAAIPAPTVTATEAPRMSSILSEIHSVVTEGVTNIKGWASDLEADLPKLAAMVARFENSPHSPIFGELEALGETILPPEAIQAVVGLIQMGGKLAAGAAGAVMPPAGPAAPAEPVAAAPVAG